MGNFMDTPGVGGLSYNNYQNLLGYGQSSSSPSLLGMGPSGVLGGNTPGVGNTPDSSPMGIFDGFLQQRNKDGSTFGGWGTSALGIAQGLGSAWMGMKQYGLAKDTLQNNKDQFNKNYAAQKQTTNSALEDRQRARVASNSGAYESVGNYMTKNGIA